MPLQNIHVRTEITSADYLAASAFTPLNWFYRRAIQLAGYHFGWHPGQYVERVNEPGIRTRKHTYVHDAQRPLLTGNPLGFFHCISAEKKADLEDRPSLRTEFKPVQIPTGADSF